MSHITKLSVALWSITVLAAGAAMIEDAGAAEATSARTWTALAVSSEGKWGAASGATESAARLAALSACSAKHVGTDDCASRTSSAEGEWHQAYACGKQHFAVGGVGRIGVELNAAYEQAETAIASPHETPGCQLLVTVKPNGTVEHVAGM